jgi:YkoY family integral membrane protein
LKYGIIGAYVFRGVALVFASILIKVSWLKLLGGAYLIYLFVHFFYKRIFKHEHILEIEQEELRLEVKHPRKLPFLSLFWSTVVMIELMDLTFSIDNVFAAVAFTDNIYLVCLGVFIGILAMRVVAGYFVKLMERFPFLDSIAFTIIGILGVKLCLGFYCQSFGAGNHFCEFMESEKADLVFSIGTVTLFFVPIMTSLLFGIPKGKPKE